MNTHKRIRTIRRYAAYCAAGALVAASAALGVTLATAPGVTCDMDTAATNPAACRALLPPCPTEDSTWCYWDGDPLDVINFQDGWYVTVTSY